MAGNRVFAYHGGGYVQTLVLERKETNKQTIATTTPEKENTPLSPYLCPASQVSINVPEMNDPRVRLGIGSLWRVPYSKTEEGTQGKITL